MQAVPDMDALLDEMEAEVPAKPGQDHRLQQRRDALPPDSEHVVTPPAFIHRLSRSSDIPDFDTLCPLQIPPRRAPESLVSLAGPSSDAATTLLASKIAKKCSDISQKENQAPAPLVRQAPEHAAALEAFDSGGDEDRISTTSTEIRGRLQMSEPTPALDAPTNKFKTSTEDVVKTEDDYERMLQYLSGFEDSGSATASNIQGHSSSYQNAEPPSSPESQEHSVPPSNENGFSVSQAHENSISDLPIQNQASALGELSEDEEPIAEDVQDEVVQAVPMPVMKDSTVDSGNESEPESEGEEPEPRVPVGRPANSAEQLARAAESVAEAVVDAISIEVEEACKDILHATTAAVSLMIDDVELSSSTEERKHETEKDGIEEKESGDPTPTQDSSLKCSREVAEKIAEQLMEEMDKTQECSDVEVARCEDVVKELSLDDVVPRLNAGHDHEDVLSEGDLTSVAAFSETSSTHLQEVNPIQLGVEVKYVPADESRNQTEDDQVESDCDENGGMMTAIECSPVPQEFSDATEEVDPEDSEVARVEVEAPVNPIATFHDLDDDSGPMRLTESELMLGKQKPFWIPDSDCDSCMLCSLKFSLLLRRHHCRACGRVLCAGCCSEKAILEYMKEDGKKPSVAKVCTPCLNMLDKIEKYEQNRATGETDVPSSFRRGVLKSRASSITESSAPEEASSSNGESARRSVMFRDGIRPGSSSATPESQEKSTALKPKKKPRKRPNVARRVAEMKLEDELASVLPTSLSEQVLIEGNDGPNFVDPDWISEKLRNNSPITVYLKKNLVCVVRVTKVREMDVWCICSNGFFSVGLDEVVFVWKKEKPDDFNLPLNVLERIGMVFCSSDASESAGVRSVSGRLPAIHSNPTASSPLTKHIYFYRPTSQNFGSLILPSTPFLVASFLCDEELPWVMACPNRVLLRLGLKYSCYPFPFVNIPGREPVFSTETSQTVMKVFTDFRSWSYRMQHIPGSTVHLTNERTVLRIPKSAKYEISNIVSRNRSMLAWCCDIDVKADSHLVCEEDHGIYSTQVFTIGSSRNATGTSFVIIDGALKSHGSMMVSVVEDGVAIRLQPDRFMALVEALTAKELTNFEIKDSDQTQFVIEWVDDNLNCSKYSPKSDIDELFLGDKFQYGLSLERAILSMLPVANSPDLGLRLSHVYNLRRGRLTPDEEPKIFSVAEHVFKESSSLLDPFVPMLLSMMIRNISIRILASPDTVEYDVAQWVGLEDEQATFKEGLHHLIPVFYNILQYLPNGFHMELVLSIICTASLPIS